MSFFAEMYYYFTVPLFEWKEQRWVKRHFYQDLQFKALDEKLLSGPNPYPIARVFPYGETPLRVLNQLAQALQLKSTDHFVDLGCGRGRGVFFMSYFFGCAATGIDLTDAFIKPAKCLNTNPRVTFICQDFLTYDFKDATCVYLYGITYSESCLAKLKEKLMRLPKGSQIVTVSEPLFEGGRLSSIDAEFPWGKTTLFVIKV